MTGRPRFESQSGVLREGVEGKRPSRFDDARTSPRDVWPEGFPYTRRAFSESVGRLVVFGTDDIPSGAVLARDLASFTVEVWGEVRGECLDYVSGTRHLCLDQWAVRSTLNLATSDCTSRQHSVSCGGSVAWYTGVASPRETRGQSLYAEYKTEADETPWKPPRSPMASLVLTDSSQLTADGFEKLPDQIIDRPHMSQNLPYVTIPFQTRAQDSNLATCRYRVLCNDCCLYAGLCTPGKEQMDPTIRLSVGEGGLLVYTVHYLSAIVSAISLRKHVECSLDLELAAFSTSLQDP
uniref:Uncharacterized protein n=1 Tax=Timema bartmani TaxID=61472 RepID=A0A7R9EXJ4_9NEOP|nr:unnamed protein product [Timema bartmani]